MSYAPSSWKATPVASAYELHVLKRLGCGWSRAGLDAVRAAGGIDTWLQRQLEPGSVPENALTQQVDSWFAVLTRTPAQKAASHNADTYRNWQYGLDLANWSTLRRMYTARPVLETLHKAAGILAAAHARG